MDYKIIGSGSSGNCVVIDHDMMFDIGLPFKKIHDSLFGIKYIFITHIHTDHLNVSTANHIRRLFPDIKFIGNEQVNKKFKVDVLAEANQPIELSNGVTITPFFAPHNVLVYGFTWQRCDKNYIYVTDTNSLRNAPTKEDNGGYDYCFIEANHDHRIIEQLIAQGKTNYGYNVVDGALRHLSIQDSKAFFFLNRRDDNAEWIQLHKSSRFY